VRRHLEARSSGTYRIGGLVAVFLVVLAPDTPRTERIDSAARLARGAGVLPSRTDPGRASLREHMTRRYHRFSRLQGRPRTWRADSTQSSGEKC
jgi:hypothetical protein